MKNKFSAGSAIFWLLILGTSYFVSLRNYLLFHSLAEFFSIAISICIFLFALNTRRYLEDSFFLFIGIAYLFIGSLDLLHTLSYKGMGVFSIPGSNLATQLWVATRYLESFTLLLAPLFIARKIKLPLLFLPFIIISGLLLTSLFYWHHFPASFEEGVGLTPFKKISEYLISLILVAALYHLWQRRQEFEPAVLRLLLASIILTIFAELTFTFYINVYGLFNFFGHLLKIGSFYCVYRAVIVTGLETPYSILLRSLKQKEENLQKAHNNLENRVKERTDALNKTNKELHREIIEKKEARQELEKREAYLRAIFDAAESVAFILTDTSVTSLIIEFSPGAEKMFGYNRREMINQSEGLLYPTDKSSAILEEISGKISSGEIGYDGEVTMVRKNGEEFPALLHIEPIKNALGEKIALTVAIDITTRKKAEEEIRRAKVEWDKTFDSVTALITILDENLRIVRCNAPVSEIFTSNSSQLIDRFCYEVFHNRSEACPNCPALASIKNLQSHEREIEFKKFEKVFHVTTSPIIEDQGSVIRLVHIGVDITEKKKMELQLRQSQKMEAIGTLAGGIAHDFNNILTSIIGFAELVREDLPADSQSAADQDMVLNAAERARQLISQILSFSRQTGKDIKPVYLQYIIKEALMMLRASIPSNIEIRKDINPYCSPVMADPTQMHQVLMNLCTNAYQAMREKGGILSVSLKEIEITADDPHVQLGLIPNKYLKLEICDTGEGMDKRIMERIFEPYFTTKKKGEGSGLGLSVVHGIVKSHEGHITVYSEPGLGSSFHIYLPCISEPQVQVQEKNSGPIPGGTESLLVVDDEEKIVEFLSRMLADLGYRVSPFTNSKNALQTFTAQPDNVDLVITDMTMPGLTGLELAKEISKIRPYLPIILCTGYSENITQDKIEELGLKQLLTKPLTRRELALAIRKELG